jgi:hypothetical protein
MTGPLPVTYIVLWIHIGPQYSKKPPPDPEGKTSINV